MEVVAQLKLLVFLLVVHDLCVLTVDIFDENLCCEIKFGSDQIDSTARILNATLYDIVI